MKHVLGFVIVVVLSVFMITPLFSGGFFPMHDDTQVARVVEMGRALRLGQFPVRWVSELGYGLGYPLFNFYGPLPYYVGGVLYALGLSGLVATKVMMGLGLVLAGVAMYVAITPLLGVSSGIIASVFYMYAPYHAVDAYVRGAVGEYWGLVFLPLIVSGILRRRPLLGALGISGLILSHTILGFVGVVLMLVSVVIVRFRKDVVVMTGLGLGLSSFFWIPALVEMNYTNVSSVIGSTANYKEHFVCLSQLWNSAWGFGGSAPGCLDGLSLKIGRIHLLVGALSILGVWGLIRQRIAKTVVVVGTVLLAVSVFLMLEISKPVWAVLPYFAFVQYPWRFLAFALLGVSLMVAGIPHMIRSYPIKILAVIVSVGLVITVESKWFVPQYVYSRDPADFESKEEIRYRVSKISDEYLPVGVEKPTNLDQALRDTIAESDLYTLDITQNTDTYKKFEIITDEELSIVARLAYFPGWTFMVNEQVIHPALEKGMPVLPIPVGFSTVQMKFTDTPVRTAGNVLSLISVGIFIFLYDRKNKKTIR